MATSMELAKARDRMAELLESLQIDAFLFEVEPGDDEWTLLVECAMDEGRWERVTLRFSPEHLFAEDKGAEQRLQEMLRSRLDGCEGIRSR